jgi:hypothetical protein
MHSLQVSERIGARFDPNDQGITARAGCPVCQGPLLLAACLGLNPAGPAQHIYRCEVCGHLEWFDRPVSGHATQ